MIGHHPYLSLPTPPGISNFLFFKTSPTILTQVDKGAVRLDTCKFQQKEILKDLDVQRFKAVKIAFAFFLFRSRFFQQPSLTGVKLLG